MEIEPVDVLPKKFGNGLAPHVPSGPISGRSRVVNVNQGGHHSDPNSVGSSTITPLKPNTPQPQLHFHFQSFVLQIIGDAKAKAKTK